MAEKKEEKQAQPKPKEKLLALTVLVKFVDGNLREFFQQYGYNGEEWPANEVRHIPEWLARRCEQSGAQLERADD